MWFNIFFFGALVVVFGIIFLLRWRTNRAWTAAAAELGLDFEQRAGFTRMPRMKGRIDDVNVEVSAWTTGGRYASKYTRFETEYESVGPEFTLTNQPIWDINMRRMGRVDLQTEDKAFDDEVFVESDDVAGTLLYLTPERREPIRALFEDAKTVTITQTGARVSLRRMRGRPQTLIDMTRRLVEMER